MSVLKSLQSSKRAMRKAMASVLRGLPQTEINAQSEQAVRRIVESQAFQRSHNISCYLSMPAGELNTSTLVSAILRSGKSLFVPKIDPTVEGRMDFVKVYGEADLESFPEGLWGIKEPSSHWEGQLRPSVLNDASLSLDLIVVPGVAFDHSLSRLGHGKGYYDRFITTYTASHGSRKPLLVALALREQVMDSGEVPTAPHDWKMDAVVGPDGVLGNCLTDLP